MIESPENLIEIPSRRKFFFFLGTLFAVAAVNPGQLITPANQLSTQWIISTDNTTQFMSLEELNQMLKEIYLPLIREQMNSSPKCLARWGKERRSYESKVVHT